MESLRTPDSRFADLPGWRWPPHYATLPEAQGLRMHYVDVPGPGDAVFLCLHGNPSWSYLYRRMIPVFARAGRVVAPDLLGFGRSDKPADEKDHAFEWHRQVLIELVEALDLRHVTLVVQDWGGIFGLTLPMALPGRVERLVVMNTALPAGDGLTAGFVQWKAFSNSQPDMAIGRLLARGNPHLSAAQAAAYDAPFPDASYKAAIRAFPNLVPLAPEDPGAARCREAREFLRTQWDGQTFMAVGAADPVLGVEAMDALRGFIRGCPEPMVLPQGGHFVQEHGEAIAEAALKAFGYSSA